MNWRMASSLLCCLFVLIPCGRALRSLRRPIHSPEGHDVIHTAEIIRFGRGGIGGARSNEGCAIGSSVHLSIIQFRLRRDDPCMYLRIFILVVSSVQRTSPVRGGFYHQLATSSNIEKAADTFCLLQFARSLIKWMFRGFVAACIVCLILMVVGFFNTLLH